MSTFTDSDIQKYIQNEQYSELITNLDAYSKKSTDTASNDKLVYVKAIACIYTDQFTTAIDILKQYTNKHLFELSYAQYRAKQYSAALQTIQQLNESHHNTHTYHLLAQIYYRLNQFQQCQQVYTKHLSQDVSVDTELQTNITAAYIAADNSTEGIQFLKQYNIDGSAIHEGYELLYNIASLYAANNDITSASHLITRTDKLARTELQTESNKSSIIELERELVQITAQNAYIQSLADKHVPAVKLYKRVLSLKSTDTSTNSTCHNNIAAIEYNTTGVVDKERLHNIKLKDDKLSHTQRTTILINRMILGLQQNKYKAVSRQAAKLRQHQPHNELLTVIEACILLTQKKVSECEALINSYVSTQPNNSLYCHLMLAHIQLQANNNQTAIETLNKVNTQYTQVKYQPALVSVLIELYITTNNTSAINQLYSDALKYWSVSTAYDAVDNRSAIAQQYAIYQATQNNWSTVVDVYKQLLSSSTATEQRKQQWTVQLIYASQHTDNIDTTQLAETLMTSKLESTKVNVDDLEQRLAGLRTAKSVTTTSSKKSKRTIRYPKNYDPNNPTTPDPERWLPKYERSNYRSKKNKRQANEFRGAQGSANVSSTSTSTSTAAVNNNSTQKVEATPLQSAAAKKAAQKKKKGKK